MALLCEECFSEIESNLATGVRTRLLCDMSREGIYLIEVAEWFGCCNRCSTIEQVGNTTMPSVNGKIFKLASEV